MADEEKVADTAEEVAEKDEVETKVVAEVVAKAEIVNVSKVATLKINTTPPQNMEI